MTSPPVVLYLPNEAQVGDQRGYRRGLRDMVQRGVIRGAHAYSLLHFVRAGGGASARDTVPALIRDLRPDVVWLQHTTGAGLTAAHFRDWRAAGDFAMVYQEMDPFSANEPAPLTITWSAALPASAASRGSRCRHRPNGSISW